MRLALLSLIAVTLWGYTDGSVLVGDAGATTVTITNTGSLGGTQVIGLPVTGTNYFKVWFAIAGDFPQPGSSSSCAAPCAVSMNTEINQNSYWYQIFNSSNTLLSSSSRMYLKQTLAANLTPPFTVPITVHGAGPLVKNLAWNPGVMGSTSGLRVWERIFNTRQGIHYVSVNDTKHQLASVDITGLTSNGTACTVTTQKPHGLSSSQVVQLWGLSSIGASATGWATPVQGLQTITSIPTTSTFTFACSLASGDWYTAFGGAGGVGVDRGATVSGSMYYTGEHAYFGGLSGPHGETYQVLLPLGSSEIVSNTTNVIGLGYNGHGDVSINGLVHGAGYVMGLNVLGPDFAVTSIVVSGSTPQVATVTLGSSPGWANGSAVHIRDAPGCWGALNDVHTITSITANVFTYNITTAPTEGNIPCTIANGTYVAPTSIDTGVAPQPVIYAAQAYIPPADFTAINPAAYSGYGGNATNGKTFFTSGTLKEPNSFFANNASLGHCSSCHVSNPTNPGYDLKYYSFPPEVIRAATLDRGGSETNANDVVAWIASIPVGYTGRPWDPPYQPGPGLDSNAIGSWAAGAGADWIFTYDEDTKPYITASTYGQFTTNGTINNREIPVFYGLPVWNKWLPEVAPEDVCNVGVGSCGGAWLSTPSWAHYQCYYGIGSGCTAVTANNYSSYHTVGAFFQQLSNDYGTFFGTPGNDATIPQGTLPSQPWLQLYSLNKWYPSRMWELMQNLQEENFSDQATSAIYGAPNARAGAQYTRGWFVNPTFQPGPHKTTVKNLEYQYENLSGQRNSNYNIDSAEWYQLSAVIDLGNRLSQPGGPIDYGYYYKFIFNLAFSTRPSFWNMAEAIGSQVQQTFGNTDLQFSGAYMNIGSITRADFAINQQYMDLFTPQADIDTELEAYAKLMLATLNTFSTGDWQSFFTTINDCHLAPPTLSAGQIPSFCMQDSFAYALEAFNSLGVDSTTKSGILTKLNAIWGAGTFDSYAAKSCGYNATPGGYPPRAFYSC